jgi:hypothetical protein
VSGCFLVIQEAMHFYLFVAVTPGTDKVLSGFIY